MTAAAMAPADVRRLREGRGIGRGGAYHPWLTVREVPSLGLASREPGMKTGRTHHLLSKLETSVFHLLDWAPSVEDVREQFPLLTLEETLALAEEAGVRHPRVPGTRAWSVRSTDFVITVGAGLDRRDVAIACKYARDLDGTRELEKLELERRYWSVRGVEWWLVTEREVPSDLAWNARWVRGQACRDGRVLPRGYDVERLIRDLLDVLMDAPECPLGIACLAYDDQLGLRLGTSLSLARHALATARWSADRTVRWGADRPLPALQQGPPARTALASVVGDPLGVARASVAGLLCGAK